MIYFDHNATTPIDDRVFEAMQPFLKNMYGNPSSGHRLGRIAKSAIEIAREQIAAIVEVEPAQVIFTSGGTEANNLALHSAFGRVAISAIEHSSISECAKRYLPEIIAVNRDGLIESQTIAELIEKPLNFVSVMLANNETGIIQPIAQIAQQFIDQGIIFHTDAVQALGKIPISFEQLHVQMMSISSHKIFGSKGCGALIVDKMTVISAHLLGGGQEHGYRSGTENVAAIVGFGKAAELAKSELEARQTRMLSLRTMLENKLLLLPKVTLFSQFAPRLPNTILFGIEGVDGELVLLKLDQKGICVSSGSACANNDKVQPSHVLLAAGITPLQAQTAIRVSLSHQNTPAEILEFIELITPFGV